MEVGTIYAGGSTNSYSLLWEAVYISYLFTLDEFCQHMSAPINGYSHSDDSFGELHWYAISWADPCNPATQTVGNEWLFLC